MSPNRDLRRGGGRFSYSFRQGCAWVSASGGPVLCQLPLQIPPAVGWRCHFACRLVALTPHFMPARTSSPHITLGSPPCEADSPQVASPRNTQPPTRRLPLAETPPSCLVNWFNVRREKVIDGHWIVLQTPRIYLPESVSGRIRL